MLDRFDPRTETFTHYPLQVPGPTVRSPIVLQISQDQQGQIWLATGSGLFRLDPTTSAMALFQHDPRDPLSLSSSDVKATLEDRNHNFWVASGGGVDEFDRRTGKLTLHIPIQPPVREFQLYEDVEGLLWLAYASGGGAGLSRYDPKSNSLSEFVFASRVVPGVAFTGVYAITEDHERNLWLGTGGIGLLKLDRSGGRFLRYRNVPEDPESIAEDHVTALLADKAGNMWVGLHSKAPNFFGLQPPPFRHVTRTLGTNSGGDTLVGSVFQDGGGTLWIGSTGGLTRLDPQSGMSTFYRTAQNTVSASVVSILQDPSGDLWLGTVGQGLKLFDPSSGRVKKTYMHEDSNPTSLSGDTVLGIAYDDAGKLWVSTWNGLDRFDTATQSFSVYKLDPNQRTERYYKLVKDPRGILWIGGDSGLTRFNPSTSEFTVLRHTEHSGTISSSDVKSVFIDSRRRLWAATQDGLNRLNADGTFTSLRKEDGLGGNAVSCILEDAAGNLWVSTNRGLSRLNPQTLEFTNYSAADGLGDLTGWSACYQNSGGEMYFGGFSGLIAFYPDEVLNTPLRAPVRLTDLKIQGQSVAIGPASALMQSAAYAEGITLDHDQRNFSLEFASLNFLNAGATRYRYRMEGLDSQWNETGSDQRIVSYSNLPAGNYIFHVQAAVARSPWSGPGAALRIRILPPWWRSYWFTGTLAALLVLSGWGAYRYRLHQIARQFAMRFEERVSERTRIARELHDSLLQGFQGLMFRLWAIRDLLPDRSAEAAASLEKALERGEETITDAREAVQDLRSSSLVSSSLEHALKELSEELPSDQTSFQVVAEGSPRELAPLLRDEAYRIAREAFRNSVRHAHARKIEAEIEYGNSNFSLRVRDDGEGIDRDVLTRGGRTGHWGLQGMRERAEQLGGQLNVWSERGAGTEIELIIPAAVAYRSAPGHHAPDTSV
jgi:signal transduction histidine kinase/ligand-binding sensor domain-containing protein